MRICLLISLTLLILLSACSVSKTNESSVMKSDYGLLRLVGDPVGREVSLDGNVLSLDPKKTVNIFELKSGIYNLEIRSQDRILLSQKLLIVNAQSNEVKMP